jgi:hypothetical protein
MRMMMKMFACGFERTNIFCFINERVGWKLVENYMVRNHFHNQNLETLVIINDVTLWSSKWSHNQCYLWNK